MHHRFPVPFGDGLVRVVCPSMKEFISSSAFGCDSTIADIARPPFGGMFFALQLLLNAVDNSLAPSGSFRGRWRDHPIWIAQLGVHGYRTVKNIGRAWRTPWLAADAPEYKDISLQVLDEITTPLPYLRDTEVFRRMVYMCRQPRTDDLRWLTVKDLWKLREQSKRGGSGFWSKMRAWLLRQRLSDEAREALGGRVGGRSSGRRRHDQRALRRVRTDRG